MLGFLELSAIAPVRPGAIKLRAAAFLKGCGLMFWAVAIPVWNHADVSIKSG